MGPFPIASTTGEKHRSESKIVICFVDLKKTFDNVSRGALRIVLGKLGCTEKLVRVFKTSACRNAVLRRCEY